MILGKLKRLFSKSLAGRVDRRLRTGSSAIIETRGVIPASASVVNDFAYLLDNLWMERHAAVERYCNLRLPLP